MKNHLLFIIFSGLTVFGYGQSNIKVLVKVNQPKDCVINIVEDVANDAMIKVYPNPTNDNLQIESIDPIYEISLIDINGRKRYSNFYEEGETKIVIPTREYSSGIYYLFLNSKTTTKSIKVALN